jgi:hypothetical protein
VAHLVQKDEKYNTILHRNTSYREDARDRLKSLEVYDNLAAIQTGVRRQNQFQGARFSDPAVARHFALTCNRYMFDYRNRDRIPSYKNFAHGDKPYGNQAHHIVVCELFYDDWKAKELDVVLQCGYNINDPDNIIYLPQGHGGDHTSCYYHNLPNHAVGHDKYNDKVLKHVNRLKQKVRKALTSDCEEAAKIHTEIFNFLKDLEVTFTLQILAKGPGPLG